ncbi:TonB-dependent receptor [Methylotenera versatilis]|uniref:TonB-dependent receptor n=1 Tax=Methylotenera versatilis TaxID=1055487 RepID=UPI0006470677|nr:TonB-dependent siderophore receptor [Methylotenera versatilis]
MASAVNLFKIKPLALAVSLTLSWAGVATAETVESPDTLPEVVTKGKATPVTEGYKTNKSTTATRTDTLLKDVPQSITVTTKELMQDQAVQNLGDVVRYTPGVGAAQGEGNRETFIFRGNSTTGDFFVDGMRDDTQYYRDLYNTERVEILKGPNGMIFGRGGAGGVINRVSKEASWDTVRQLGLQYGSYDQKRVTLDAGTAINDVAAIRLNAMYEDGNSYRDGVSLERKGINPTITIKPSEDTKVVLGAEYFKDDRIADRGVSSFQGRPLDTKRSQFFGDASNSPTNTEVKAFNASIEHAFNDTISIRNKTRYADYDKFYQNVFPGAVNAVGTTVSISAYNNATERTNLFNQTDAIFKVDTGNIKHELLAGMELGRQKTDNFRNTGFVGATTTTSISVPLSNPTTNFPFSFRQSGTDADNHTVTDITAFYLQDQIKFTPQWEAVIGARHDRFETDFTNYRQPIGNASRNIEVTDNLFSPRAGLIYKPIEPVSVYTSYSVSYVPRAGDQLASLTPTNKAFDPEKFKNLELGVKWDYSPDLALTAAIYKLERENLAITDPNNPAGPQILTDGQESKGFEFGVNGKITSKWSVAGGYAYQDAEFTKRQGNANPANVIEKGTNVAQVPKHTFSLWNRYDFNETWGAAIGVITRSDMYAATPVVGSATVASSVKLPGYTRIDAAVFAKINNNLRAQLNIENLFDKDYYLYANSNNNITPGSPVAGRLSLIADF